MEGRKVLETLTVEENLRIGGYTRRDPDGVQHDVKMIYDYFPVLVERRHQVAGHLSGGEQQMLVIGLALTARPKVLLLDEPSLGLAPLPVREIFDIIRKINDERGTTFLLVEQNAQIALRIADYGYIMENGRVVFDGPATTLRGNDDVREFYLGRNWGRALLSAEILRGHALQEFAQRAAPRRAVFASVAVMT
jgi:branched-chain amino acid transport system ATP-binding protein